MTEINPPETFARLVPTGYTLEREESAVWGARQWKMTCERCGKVFHPVNTVDSLSQMLGHNAIVGGAIVVCRGVTR